MAYELINNGPATPHRIHALLKLVARLGTANQVEVFSLLQPDVLGYDQQAPRDAWEAAVRLGFLYALETQQPEKFKLQTEALPLESVEDFRHQMQRRVLGATIQSQPNYMFNLFTAWYATQDENALQGSAADLATNFNTQLRLERSEGALNTQKFSAWKTWSQFLGLCWPLKVPGLDEINVPNAYSRLKALLPELLPEPDKLIDFNLFSHALAQRCPELDGGSLFEQCWQASKGAEAHASRVSLMLSNALRQLHDAGTIELVQRADAVSRWNLYRATGHPIQQVTHIRLRSN